MNKKSKKDFTFGKPGAFSLARNQAGGDICAAALLYRVKWRWEMKGKLERFGREWVAMSRSDWALEAGLSEGEMKNRALPKLRKSDFIEIRQMKLTPSGPKLLWIHLDLALLYQSTLPEDMWHGKLNKTGVYPKDTPYEYGNKDK